MNDDKAKAAFKILWREIRKAMNENYIEPDSDAWLILISLTNALQYIFVEVYE